MSKTLWYVRPKNCSTFAVIVTATLLTVSTADISLTDIIDVPNTPFISAEALQNGCDKCRTCIFVVTKVALYFLLLSSCDRALSLGYYDYTE